MSSMDPPLPLSIEALLASFHSLFQSYVWTEAPGAEFWLLTGVVSISSAFLSVSFLTSLSHKATKIWMDFRASGILSSSNIISLMCGALIAPVDH